jgi:hypothetical protein
LIYKPKSLKDEIKFLETASIKTSVVHFVLIPNLIAMSLAFRSFISNKSALSSLLKAIANDSPNPNYCERLNANSIDSSFSGFATINQPSAFASNSKKISSGI